MKKFILKREEEKNRHENYNIPYAELLNKQQLEAVFYDYGATLVIAGAGTGKTRTLVYRVARLVESGVEPSEILLLTFTRRAAKEMINRASSILDERCKRVKGGTFHFYCSQLLHKYAEYIGFPNNFTIIDTSDALEIVQLVRTRLQLHKKEKRFPNKSTLYSILSTCKNKNLDLKVVLLESYPQFIDYHDKIIQVIDGYEKYKANNYVMDFDDLLIKTVELLEQHDDIRIKVSAKHKFVMVDEYQDTNKLQAKLTALFSCVHGNIMGVGDDAQSIYSFRGADHQNIMEFPKIFNNTQVIKLEENYRSTPQILNAANKILDQASFKFNKHLFSRKSNSEIPALVKAPSRHDQSRFVTQAILQLREQDIQLNEISVLFRNGRDSFDLEVELNRKNVPFVKYGGQKFTEAAHIKDVLAHVRVLINPKDTLAWNRVLMLIDGIGPKTAQDLFEWIKVSESPYRFDTSGAVSTTYLKQLKELSNLLLKAKKDEQSVSNIIGDIVDYYRVFCEKRYDDYPKRLKDLEVFTNISINYSSLEVLLEGLALDPITVSAIDTEQKYKDEAPLILSTIHSSKGLEWAHVFIINCLDGILPSSYAVENDDQLDEELRLLYVATTRAKQMLYYSYPALAQSFHGDYFTQLSRFLIPLEESEIETWALMEETKDEFNGNDHYLTE